MNGAAALARQYPLRKPVALRRQPARWNHGPLEGAGACAGS